MLKFEKLTKENYCELIKIKHFLFPESNSDCDYDKYFNNQQNSDYFLVTFNGKPCAITGWYDFDDSNTDGFMGWFGVMPEFRNKGIGRKILEFTVKEVEKHNFNYFRVYTDKVVNKESANLYESEGFIKEDYTYPDKIGLTNNFVVFTKVINSNGNDLWNNRPLNEDDNYEL